MRPDPLPLTAPLPNPERGFYRTDLNPFDPDPEALAAMSSEVRLVYPYQGWLPRDRPLRQEELAGLRRTFRLVRENGLKLVLRFRYGEDGDADWGVIETHLDQLLPIVRENADLVYVFQAGFLGRWGEGHCWRATAVCHDDWNSKRRLLDRLFSELPAGLPIAVRYPLDKARYLAGRPPPAPPVPLDHPPSGAAGAERLAHFNDCFLSSATDVGTYPEENPGTWRAYVYAENDFLPFGGETCAPTDRDDPGRTRPPRVLEELAAAHPDYLNAEYHPGMLRAWREAGVLEEVAARLGYRLELLEARWPAAVPARGGAVLELVLRNRGFARPKRRRPAYLVVSRGGRGRPYPLALDLRRLAPGEVVRTRIAVELDEAPGRAELGLWFPDPSRRLRSDPRYALRLASDLPFREGVHRLGEIELR